MQLQTSLPTVELGFRFEDGCKNAVPVEWHRWMTVLDALTSASEKEHGIKFRSTGEGPTAFVIEIDGQANDMIGNWMYRVNGERPMVGCGKFVLKPGDIVLWEFVPFDPHAR